MPKAKSRSNGKKIDTWFYEYAGVSDPEADDPEVKPIKVPVNLYIYKKFDGTAPPLVAKEVWFTVECEKPEFELEGSDIEALRAAMWEHLDTHFKVKWETYFLVEIDHRGPYSGLGSGLSFGYRTVYKGTAYDGTLLLREYVYARGDVISPWPGEFRDERGTSIACIPDNEVNRKALEEFSARIDALRERLVDLIRPDRIEHTLLTLSSQFLLPPAADKPE